MIRVSIIVPAFNAQGSIGEALRSACAQSERDLEVIVVDDASTDRTADLVEAAARHDGRIRLLRSASNGGPAAARNRGLAAAGGEWIALLDADDAMEPRRLDALLELARRHHADMVSDNLLLVPQDDPSSAEPMIPRELLGSDSRLPFDEFVRRNVGDPRGRRLSYGFMKPMIRRAFLERHAIRYDESVRFAEDFAFYVRCLDSGAAWWLTPEPLYRYTVRADSLTQVQTAADLDRLRQRQRSLLREDRVCADPALAAAIRRHLRGIDRSYHYRAFTDAVKARRARQACRLLLASPGSVASIFAESLRQAPVILRKWRRGGYRRGEGRDAAVRPAGPPPPREA